MADQLTPDEQEKLVEHMKLQWLRREVQKGIDAADRGELVDGDEAFSQLIHRLRNGRSKQ
jgi:predicted transcriptional regulator